MISLVFAAVLLALGLLAGWKFREAADRARGAKAQEAEPEPEPRTGLDLFTDEIVFSIKTEPEAWAVADKYRFRHKSGLALWIANEAYGMRVYEPTEIDDFTDAQKNRLWEAYLEHGKAGLHGTHREKLDRVRPLLFGKPDSRYPYKA